MLSKTDVGGSKQNLKGVKKYIRFQEHFQSETTKGAKELSVC